MSAITTALEPGGSEPGPHSSATPARDSAIEVGAPAVVRPESSNPPGARFRALCIAAGASSLGDGAVFVAFPLVAASLTRDPRLVAGVAVAQRLPWLFFSMPTGALADRLDRRRLIGAVELTRMALVGLLGLTLAGHLHPLLALYVVAFLLGTLETAFQAASTAVIPSLVPEPGRARANGKLYAVQMSGQSALGPTLGGLMVAAAVGLPFIFDGASFAASAVILLVALPRLARPAAPPSGLRTQAGQILEEMGEGLRWFLGRRAVRLSAAFVSGLAFCQSAVFAILVLWAGQDLQLRAAGYGVLVSVASIGLVGAALLAGRLYERFGPGLLLLGSGAVAAGAYLVMSLTHSVVVAAVAMIFEGASVSTGNVASGTLRQKLIPQHLLGRVGNVIRTFIYGAMPLGAVAGGVISSALGLRQTLLVAALAQGALVVTVGPALVSSLRLVGLARIRRHAASADLGVSSAAAGITSQ